MASLVYLGENMAFACVVTLTSLLYKGGNFAVTKLGDWYVQVIWACEKRHQVVGLVLVIVV